MLAEMWGPHTLTQLVECQLIQSLRSAILENLITSATHKHLEILPVVCALVKYSSINAQEAL